MPHHALPHHALPRHAQPETEPAAVLAAVTDFVARIDPLEPAAPAVGTLALRLAGAELEVELRAPVAEALMAALRAYQDPRDRGECAHCGGRQIDDNFLCRACGAPNGVFGTLLAELAARHADPTALT